MIKKLFICLIILFSLCMSNNLLHFKNEQNNSGIIIPVEFIKYVTYEQTLSKKFLLQIYLKNKEEPIKILIKDNLSLKKTLFDLFKTLKIDYKFFDFDAE